MEVITYKGQTSGGRRGEFQSVSQRRIGPNQVGLELSTTGDCHFILLIEEELARAAGLPTKLMLAFNQAASSALTYLRSTLVLSRLLREAPHVQKLCGGPRSLQLLAAPELGAIKVLEADKDWISLHPRS
ncbi:unnamed protein product [Nezara viridula]|uniref:Uncharacterized protein n=1 Tax=Nezara viridula TaxID=85310 RepID=A0A9P0H8F0_NEZVI|nr:unnamed protein product [Nezara viridula]